MGLDDLIRLNQRFAAGLRGDAQPATEELQLIQRWRDTWPGILLGSIPQTMEQKLERESEIIRFKADSKRLAIQCEKRGIESRPLAKAQLVQFTSSLSGYSGLSGEDVDQCCEAVVLLENKLLAEHESTPLSPQASSQHEAPKQASTNISQSADDARAADAQPNKTSMSDAEGLAIEQLERDTPPFDRSNGLWVKNADAASIEGLSETASLGDYRKPSQGGEKTSDGMFGRDRDGRIWRRPGTARSHPWYLRRTLRNAGNNEQTPEKTLESGIP